MKLSIWNIAHWLKKMNYITKLNIDSGEPIITRVSFVENEILNKEYLYVYSSDYIIDNHYYKTVITNGIDSIYVMEDNINLIYEEISHIFEFYNNWENKLLSALIEKKNLNELLELGHIVFQRPMFIKGNSSWAYAITPGYDSSVHPDWEKLKKSIANRTPDFDAVKIVSLDPDFQDAFTKKYPIIIKSPFYRSYVLRSNVWIEDQMVCEIIVLENDKPFNEGDTHLLNQFTKIITTYFENQNIKSITSSDFAFIFTEMIESGNFHSVTISPIRSTFRWDNNDDLIIVCIEPLQSSKTPIFNVLYDKLKSTLNYSCVFIYNHRIICIIDVTKNTSYNSIIKNIKQIIPPDAFIWGASYEFNKIENIVEAYQQALKVLSVIRDTDISGATIYDIAYKSIKKELKRVSELHLYIHPALSKLEKIDAENDSEYLITLYEFLLCGGNYTNAAKRLNLHRNSLIYRISKIKELINLDLDDHENIKLLLASFLII